MRIISGKYKGHQLISFSADHIRPTTDRVKETLFNIIQNTTPDATVLDLFSGTGNLGLEALSRGAKEVTFVENHVKSLELIRKNIEKLRITEPHFIIKQEVLSFLKSHPQKKSSDSLSSQEDTSTNRRKAGHNFQATSKFFDLILIDPPFTQQMADEVMLTLSTSSLFNENTIIAIESAKKETLQLSYHTLICTDQRQFGDKILSFFASQSPPPFLKKVKATTIDH